MRLGAGLHSLRLEFVELGGAYRLVPGAAGPDAKRPSLAGTNQSSRWHRGPGGHPQTELKSASLFRAVALPERFEVDLEFASSESPRFVFALGKDQKQALRLETWDDELVVVQGDVFDLVSTIEKDQRVVRLRLAFDGPANASAASGDDGDFS